MILLFMITFMLGMFSGAAIFMLYGFYQVKKMRKKAVGLLAKIDEIVAKATSETEAKKDSIKERLVKASDIARLQMDLKSQVEMPSKNALHSRHKNGIVYEIKELEQE